MEFHRFLPSEYHETCGTYIQKVLHSDTVEEKKKVFTLFSQKVTVLPLMWKGRINFEMLNVPFSDDIYSSCLDLEKQAIQHFYDPQYLTRFPNSKEEMRRILSMPYHNFCYRLPEPQSVKSYCIFSAVDSYFVIYYRRLEKYLTFPHSQLRKFYRYYQLHSVTPLPENIKQQYEACIKSYDYMVTIAEDPEKWIQWMQDNFQEEYWIRNLEAKLGEHWFMRKIWIFYIDFLDGKNNVEVLNVYKRYCRLFITDNDMQEKYVATTLKYSELGINVFKWLLDQAKFKYDFGSRKCDLEQMKQLIKKHQLCEKCFGEYNENYFDNRLKQQGESSCFSIFCHRKRNQLPQQCVLCEDAEKVNLKFLLLSIDAMLPLNDEADRRYYFNSLQSARSIAAQSYNPIVKLQYRDTIEPPIPLTYLNYIFDNANHEILAKLYQTCKFFFAKKLILICHQLYISTSFEQTFIQRSCSTNFTSLMNHEFIQKFCCKVFILHDDEARNYLSMSLTKICCCSLQCIKIGHQDLTLKEFLMVTEGGKLEQLELEDVKIFKDDGKTLVIEEIVELLPTVVDLALVLNTMDAYTPATTEKLLNLQRSVKFESIELDQVPETFDFTHFHTFLKEKMIAKAHVNLGLREDVDQDFIVEYILFCNAIISSWDPIYEAPIMH